MNILHYIKQPIKALAQCRRGVAMIEFALALPLLIFMFVGAVEVSRYLLVVQKLENVDSQIADVAALLNPLSNTFQTTTCSTLNGVLGAVKDLMSPYTNPAAGATNSNIVVYITAVKSDDTAKATVEWQQQGGGTYSPTNCPQQSCSLPATPGTDVTTYLATAGITMAADSEVVVVEVYYVFNPILANTTIVQSNLQLYRIFAEPTRYYVENGILLTAYVPGSCNQ